MRYLRLLVSLCLPAFLYAQAPEGAFEGRPAIILSNGTLELAVLKQGASFVNLVLADDPDKLNPLWNPVRFAREEGRTDRQGAGFGHFLCLDGFGGVSAEERAAGLPGHGEAHIEQWAVRAYRKSGGITEATFHTRLPLVQENVTRTVRLVEGENVVYVETELENLLAFDRPVCWAEHATIGSPFLKPGVTAVDLNPKRSKTRPYTSARGSHRFASGVDFEWPMAPGVDGRLIDIRTAPPNPSSGDHTTSLMDPARDYVFVTALEPERRLILGYVFKPEEFPWLQTWEAYPPSLKLARGLEFSTQPFDVPRREAVSTSPLFDTPTYRWLPARSTIRAAFLFFYARTPVGMRKVDDVRLEGGKLTVEDRTAGKKLSLDASLPL